MARIKQFNFEDVSVFASTPDTLSNPSASHVMAGGSKGSTGNIAHRRLLVRPDITNVKGKVEKVRYFLNINQGQSSGNFNVYAITQPWDQNNLTWNNQPSFDSNYSYATFNMLMGTREIDITELVQKWVDGVIPNHGFIIVGKEDGPNGQGFTFEAYSREGWGFEAQRPYIDFYFNEPATKPNVVSPNGGELFDKEHTVSWTPSIDPVSQVNTGIEAQGFYNSMDYYSYISQEVIAEGTIINNIKTKFSAAQNTQVRVTISVSGFSYSKLFNFPNGYNNNANGGYCDFLLEMDQPIPSSFMGQYVTVNFTKVLGNFSLFLSNQSSNNTTRYMRSYFELEKEVYETMDTHIAMILEYGGATVKYQPQITFNNGQVWSNLLSGDGFTSQTSLIHDFTNLTETSTARLRVRSYEGMSYSGWDESDGVFTIQHNIAPNTPTAVRPINGQSVDRAISNRLEWVHNDPNSNDPQSKYDLRWRLQGDTTWHNVSEATNRQYLDISPGTFPNGVIEWQVRTYDQKGLVGDYSGLSTFLSADRPNKPVVVYPTETPVPVAQPTIQWSSNDQIAYEVTIYDATKTDVLWTDTKTSTVKALTVGASLGNLASYVVGIKIKNSQNLWSEETNFTFYVSYTPPTVPIIEIAAGDGSINIDIANPDPVGTQPSPTHNDIYKLINNEWVLIAKDFRVNFPFKDYNVKSGEEYRYKVRAQAFGVFSESVEMTASLTLRGVWIHDVLNPLDTVHQFKLSDSRSSNRLKDGVFMQFAGRARKVFEQSIFMDDSVEVGLQLLNHTNDKQALEELFEANVVCYRDNRGRMLFGIIRELPVTDEFFGQTVNISVESVDYWEGV